MNFNAINNMVKAICKLTFKDGKSVSATIHASTPEGNYPVTYEGAIETIKPSYSESVVGLIYFFKDVARQTNAKLEIVKDGKYDAWAE